MLDHGKLNMCQLSLSNYRVIMNVWTPNKQDSPHLFSVTVSYKASLHLCDYLSLDQYNK